MMNRKFVSMIAYDYSSRVYSLRRISLKQHLFHPSTQDAQKAAAAQVAKVNKKGWLSTISSFKHLPKPNINFSMPPKVADATTMHFFSLLKGQGEGSVMFVGPHVNTVMYDLDLESIFPMPEANFCKQSDSISLSMTRRSFGRDDQQLYVMDKGEDGSFEVLNYSRTGFPVEIEQWWYWKPLPSPPPGSDGKVCLPSAAAVVDDTTICVSSVDAGARAFDTVKGEWRQAGSWALPFHGAAEYVPELGLWFGLDAIDNPNHCLRAFDLSSSSSWPPVVQQDWNYLDHLPDEWLLRQRLLVNLGSGKFCIATSFENVERRAAAYSVDGMDDDIVVNDLTVLTGVEVVRTDDGLQMINHKSKRYSSECTRFHCLL